jgi:hypothetical protein
MLKKVTYERMNCYGHFVVGIVILAFVKSTIIGLWQSSSWRLTKKYTVIVNRWVMKPGNQWKILHWSTAFWLVSWWIPVYRMSQEEMFIFLEVIVSLILSKNCICTCVQFRAFPEIELFHCTGIWVWSPIQSFAPDVLRPVRFLFMGLDEA